MAQCCEVDEEDASTVTDRGQAENSAHEESEMAGDMGASDSSGGEKIYSSLSHSSAYTHLGSSAGGGGGGGGGGAGPNAGDRARGLNLGGGGGGGGRC